MFTGQPNVLYYAPTIFEEIGFESNSAATLATVGLGIVKVLMTIIALICVDRFGRRKLLLIGSTLMGLSIFILGIVCHFESASISNKACVDHSHCHSATEHSHAFATNIPDLSDTGIIASTVKSLNERDLVKNTSDNSSVLYSNTSTVVPSLNQNTHNNSITTLFDIVAINNSSDLFVKGDNSSHSSLIQKIAGFSALMCYVAAYGFSFGPVTWLVLSEIFPATVKGRAIAIATVFNWGTNLIVTFTFLDVMNALGVTWTFTVFAVICALSVMFIYSFVPETKNRTLEQVSAEMKSKSPFVRMKQNCGKLCCCFSSRHSLGSYGNYRRVQSETVT